MDPQLIFSGVIAATFGIGFWAAYREEKDNEKRRRERYERRCELEKKLNSNEYTKDEALIARLHMSKNPQPQYFDLAMRLGISPQRYEGIVKTVHEYTKRE